MPFLLYPGRFGGAAPSATAFLHLNGANYSHATTPDHSSLDITNTCEFVMKVRCVDWTPALNSTMFGKWGTSQQAYQGTYNASSTISFQWTTNGTSTTLVAIGTPPAVMTSNVWYWLRMRFNGPNRQLTIDFSPDEENEPDSGDWAQYGAASTAGASSGTFHNSTEGLSIGGIGPGEFRCFNGDYAQFIIRTTWGGSNVFSLDPDNWTTGSTWVTDTGHTMTLGAQATIDSE